MYVYIHTPYILCSTLMSHIFYIPTYMYIYTHTIHTLQHIVVKTHSTLCVCRVCTGGIKMRDGRVRLEGLRYE